MSPVFSHTFEGQHEVALWQFADLSFAVTYGAQTHQRIGYAEATERLGEALMHAATCAGLIVQEES